MLLKDGIHGSKLSFTALLVNFFIILLILLLLELSAVILLFLILLGLHLLGFLVFRNGL